MKLDITLYNWVIDYEPSEGTKRLRNSILPPIIEKKKNMEISNRARPALLAVSYVRFRLPFYQSATVHGGKSS